MALLSRRDLQSVPLSWSTKEAALNEGRRLASTSATFDIFLSHSYRDAQSLSRDDVYQLHRLLKELNLQVYVDWIVDPELDRTDVTGATASVVRARLNRSRSLLYATSQTSGESKWMPWELGYADGKTSRVAILPIIDSASDAFNGQSYLGIYPHITKRRSVGGKDVLLVIFDRHHYLGLVEWINGASVANYFDDGFW